MDKHKFTQNCRSVITAGRPPASGIVLQLVKIEDSQLATDFYHESAIDVRFVLVLDGGV